MENNQHKDFDQFFQNKMNNRQFDYQDDFWAEMELQLPEATSATTSKGDSHKRLLLLLLPMIGFLAVVGWLAYPPISNTSFITKGKENLTTETESEIDVVLSESESENQSKLIDNNNNTATITNSDNKNYKNTDGNNFINKNISSDNSNEKGRIINNATLEEVKNGVENTAETQPMAIVSESESESENQSKLIDNNNTATITNSDNKNYKNISSDNSNKKGRIINNTTLEKVKNGVENTTETQPMAIVSESESEIEATVNSMLEREENKGILLNNLLTKRFLVVDNNSEYKSNLIKPNCDGCPILPPAHQFKIGLIAGLNTSLGFQNISDSRANPSFDPMIGLRITYRHSMISQWRTAVEAIYFSRSALNTQIGYDSIRYGFGSTVVSRSIDIEELHYISVPIYATYQYNKKHAFMGGLSFNYLLNAQSQTSGNITETTANDANLYAEPTTQEWGYTTAFNRFDIGATLGYDYEVQKGWKVGARFNYGLRDVTKNNIFNNNIFDNNISLRLIMTCDLFIL